MRQTIFNSSPARGGTWPGPSASPQSWESRRTTWISFAAPATPNRVGIAHLGRVGVIVVGLRPIVAVCGGAPRCDALHPATLRSNALNHAIPRTRLGHRLRRSSSRTLPLALPSMWVILERMFASVGGSGELTLGVIAERRREIDAAESAWLAIVAAYDRSGDWRADGYASAGAALAAACHMTEGAARTHVELAAGSRRYLWSRTHSRPVTCRDSMRQSSRRRVPRSGRRR